MLNGEVILVFGEELNLEFVEEMVCVDVLEEVVETVCVDVLGEVVETVCIEVSMIGVVFLVDDLLAEFFEAGPKRSKRNLSCRVSLFPRCDLAFSFFEFIRILVSSFFLNAE